MVLLPPTWTKAALSFVKKEAIFLALLRIFRECPSFHRGGPTERILAARGNLLNFFLPGPVITGKDNQRGAGFMRKVALGLVILLVAVKILMAASPDRWLHIKVDNTGDKTERVRVNVPLDLAEKIIPAINNDKFQHGKIHCDMAKVNDIDLRAVLEALRDAKDNEFITVDSDHENVRVAKQAGNLVIKVKDEAKKKQKVDISIPFTVVNALLSGPKDQLDLAAAVRALADHGDTVLVTVTDGTSNVRIWVDSKSVAE